MPTKTKAIKRARRKGSAALRALLMNWRWHPVVFGNRYAGPSDGFETMVEAMVCAETTARAYARTVMELLR